MPRRHTGRKRPAYGLKQPEKIKSFDIGPYFIYMENGGAEFGPWIDAGSRNNGYNSGDVIENSAYVIEDIIRRVLQQTDDNIDYDSFDKAGNTTDGTLDGWKFFGAIYEIEDSRDLLERLCAQCKSKLFRDADGMFSLFVYDTSASVSYTDYKFDKDNTIKNLSLSRTPVSELVNTVRINYMLDRGSGKYQRQTFTECVKKYSGSLTAEAIDGNEYEWTVDDGTDFTAGDYILTDHELNRVESVAANVLTLYKAGPFDARVAYQSSVRTTHDDNTPIYILSTNSDNGTGTADQAAADELEAMESAWRYGTNNEFTLDADFIIDDTTAQNLRNHYFDYLKAPKYIVEFDTFMNATDLVVNDIIEFDNTIMDDYMKFGGASWSGEKFVVTNIDRHGIMEHHIVAEHLSYGFV